MRAHLVLRHRVRGTAARVEEEEQEAKEGEGEEEEEEGEEGERLHQKSLAERQGEKTQFHLCYGK